MQNVAEESPGKINLEDMLSADALGKPRIGKEEIEKATEILLKYKRGKTNLDNRIKESEKWYKIRHWESMETEKKSQIEPASGWLFNVIANKHADAMDAFPEPNVLPREEGDKPEAEALSSILPVILEQNDFEGVYDSVWNYKLKTGTGVYGIFWNSDKLNGLGDIEIKKLDILNLFWEPGIDDIQKSKNIFHVELMDNDILVSQYPQLKDKLGNSAIMVSQYCYDDEIDTNEKTAVVDWYYKKRSRSGKNILHYCKYVGDEVLFATENMPGEQTEDGYIEGFADRGLYDHGEYPFVFDVLFPVEGSPAGFGYVDIGKNAQEYIDRGNQAIMQNMLANARPRLFVKRDGGINEEEYADLTKDFVHVDGHLGQDSIMPIEGKPLPAIYVQVINNKIDELKETTGNRDISTGGSSAGVTAASAIAAMQEAGSKLSRDSNKSAYRAIRKICIILIELVRQFYTTPRWFRILGENGSYKFKQYSNAGIIPQPQGIFMGKELGMRLPLFDVEVTAQKQSPYSKMSQNELALQFYNLGFFRPQNSDMALACLDMMDFERKDFLVQKIAANGQMLQQMIMLAQILDDIRGTNEITQGIVEQYGVNVPDQGQTITAGTNISGGITGEESSVTKKERTRVAEATAPR